MATSNPHARDLLNLPQQTLGARPTQTGLHDALFCFVLLGTSEV